MAWELQSSIVSVSVTPRAFMVCSLDEVIAAFRERAPGVALRLRDRTCAQVSENLRRRCRRPRRLGRCAGT